MYLDDIMRSRLSLYILKILLHELYHMLQESNYVKISLRYLY